jgi:hypothetical protein
MALTRVYAADIVKRERDDKGNLIVYGKATSPALDHDEQICDPTWLAEAMPSWFKSAANVREQHSNIAAGVGIDLERQDGDSWMLRSKVVDPVSAKKVEEGVLKGYSIGIKNARITKDKDAPGGRIVAGSIVEVSLVDSPCNPEALLTLAKSVNGECTFVEELAEGRGRVALQLAKDLVPDAEDGADDDESNDETADIDGAQSVIADLADLIISEATELKNGRQEEAYDISILMDAVCSMQRFLCREQQQDGQTDDGSDDVMYVGLADGADLVKGKYTAEQKRQMLREGKAIANADGDPSYPIGDKDDLDKAISAVGRGGAGHDAVRRHIIRNAKKLGASDQIPDTWNSDGSLKAAPAKAVEPDTTQAANLQVDAPAPAEEPTQTTTDKSVATDPTVDITEIVNKAVAQATSESTKALSAAQESIKALSDEVARLRDTPVPGGPMLLRPQDIPNTQQTQVERYKAIAFNTSDQSVRAAYNALAKAEDA